MNAEAEGRPAAEKFRRQHGLGVQPLGDLVAVIEQATGIDVAVLDVGPDEHGLTMKDPHRNAVFIGVARTRNPMRQRSTLAHELGHVTFEDWVGNNSSNWSARSHQEVRADAFARHLLVPAGGLKEFVRDHTQVGQPTLSAVVQRYLVSPAIAAIALHQTGFIDADTKQDWMGLTARYLAIRFGWGDQYQALQADADRRRAPQRLLARAIRGFAEGVLSAQAIATLRGMTPQSIEAELGEAGIVPNERQVLWADPAELPDVQVDLAALDDDLNLLGDDRDAESEPPK